MAAGYQLIFALVSAFDFAICMRTGILRTEPPFCASAGRCGINMDFARPLGTLSSRNISKYRTPVGISLLGDIGMTRRATLHSHCRAAPGASFEIHGLHRKYSTCVGHISLLMFTKPHLFLGWRTRRAPERRFRPCHFDDAQLATEAAAKPPIIPRISLAISRLCCDDFAISSTPGRPHRHHDAMHATTTTR